MEPTHFQCAISCGLDWSLPCWLTSSRSCSPLLIGAGSDTRRRQRVTRPSLLIVLVQEWRFGRGALWGNIPTGGGPILWRHDAAVRASVPGGESAALVHISVDPVECQRDRRDRLIALDWQKLDQFASEIPSLKIARLSPMRPRAPVVKRGSRSAPSKGQLR
jgi:hypothetical protein